MDTAAPPSPPEAPPSAPPSAAVAGDWPQGFLRIPLAEATLAEAREIIQDASLFDKTRLAILHAFPQVSLAGYWELTVKDHAEMLVFLEKRGLLNG